MTAAEVARVLGAASRSGACRRCVGRVHGSGTGRSATLALRDRCNARDILAELRRQRLLGDTGGYPAARSREGGDDARSRQRRIEFAGRIWSAVREARGSPVARYLAGRGIGALPLPSSLRSAPSLRREDGRCCSAMVARVDRVDDPGGRLIGVHRAWLECDDAGATCRKISC